MRMKNHRYLMMICAVVCLGFMFEIPVTYTVGAAVHTSSNAGGASSNAGSTPSNAESDSFIPIGPPGSGVGEVRDVPVEGGLDEFVEWAKWQPGWNGVESCPDFTMTENIELNDKERQFNYPFHPATIHTNGYGFYISGNTKMKLLNEVTFIGGDSDVPMITLSKGSTLEWSSQVTLDVENGYGIYIVDSGNGFAGLQFAQISVKGTGSVGIYSERSLDLEYVNMQVEEGACGIQSDGDISLFLSEIRGEGTCVHAAGIVSLDTCALSEVPADAEQIERELSLLVGRTSAQFIREGTEPYDIIQNFKYCVSAQGMANRYVDICGTIDYTDIDVSKPGFYEAAVILEQIPFVDDKFHMEAPKIGITVMDEDEQYLIEVIINNAKMGTMLLGYPTKAEESFELYCSVDEGESWEICEFEQIYPYIPSIDLIKQFDTSQTYWFCATVRGKDTVKKTNIMKVYYEDGGFKGDGFGGKRDDSGRDTDEKPDPNPKPDPPSKPAPPLPPKPDPAPNPAPKPGSENSSRSETGSGSDSKTGTNKKSVLEADVETIYATVPQPDPMNQRDPTNQPDTAAGIDTDMQEPAESAAASIPQDSGSPPKDVETTRDTAIIPDNPASASVSAAPADETGGIRSDNQTGSADPASEKLHKQSADMFGFILFAAACVFISGIIYYQVLKERRVKRR